MSTETEKVKLIKTMTEQGTKANNKSNDRDSQRDKLCIKNQVSFTDTSQLVVQFSNRSCLFTKIFQIQANIK